MLRCSYGQEFDFQRLEETRFHSCKRRVLWLKRGHCVLIMMSLFLLLLELCYWTAYCCCFFQLVYHQTKRVNAADV